MAFKIMVFISLITCTWSTGLSQNTIEISICEALKAKSALIQLSIVIENDTFLIPYVGDGVYLDPFEYHKLSPIDCDSTWQEIPLIVETCRHTFSVFIYCEDWVYCRNFDICIEKKRKKIKHWEWLYHCCGYLGRIGIAQLIKNK